MKTNELTKIDFLTRVVNYEVNPDRWEYLGDKPSVIDFYASWCVPCQQLAPVLEELATEYEGRIYIHKVNIDQQEELAQLFAVRSVPTLLLVPMEGKPQMVQGTMPKAALKELIDRVLLVEK